MCSGRRSLVHPVVAAATVSTTHGEVSFEEAVLFTHKGLSGPAILQVSSYWRSGQPISLRLVEDAAAKLRDAKRRMPRAHLKAALAELLPKRLAEALTTRIARTTAITTDITAQLGNVADAALESVAESLSQLTFRPTGTEGYAKAEVTAGGISTAALSSKTMEVRAVPGLYFIGEAVDVTGWLGGYNFQWAWSSGVAAGARICIRKQKRRRLRREPGEGHHVLNATSQNSAEKHS